MNKKPVIIDLETKYTFRDYKDPKKLGISVIAVYSYRDDSFSAFFEEEIFRVFPILEQASYIIGFNIKEFDLPVLQAYYPGKIDSFPVFDIIDDIKIKIGRRLSLNELLLANLNKKKSGHGLQAIDYYQKKEWDKLKKYCLDDVSLTKELFDYGVNQRKIFFPTPTGKESIEVDWFKYLHDDTQNKKEIHMTLPF